MFDEQERANKARTNNLRDELMGGAVNSASELATVYYYTRTRHNSADSVPASKLVCITEVAIRTTLCIVGII